MVIRDTVGVEREGGKEGGGKHKERHVFIPEHQICFYKNSYFHYILFYGYHSQGLACCCSVVII